MQQKTLDDIVILDMISNPATKDAGFKSLVEKYQKDIYWHIRRMVHNHPDADDIIQNTFIKVYRNIGKFKRESKLYTWLYRIATNETISFINDLKKRKSSGDTDSLQEQLSADTYFDGNQAQVLLKGGIDQLPEKQRLVFNMRYYDEMTYADMSDVLDTSVGALKASYHHAVKKLEKYIKKNM